MKRLTDVPDGYYEKLIHLKVTIANNVTAKRTQNNGLIRYTIEIDGIETLIPESTFEYLFERYPARLVNEYKYMSDDYKTYSVHESINGIWSDKEDF